MDPLANVYLYTDWAGPRVSGGAARVQRHAGIRAPSKHVHSPVSAPPASRLVARPVAHTPHHVSRAGLCARYPTGSESKDLLPSPSREELGGSGRQPGASGERTLLITLFALVSCVHTSRHAFSRCLGSRFAVCRAPVNLLARKPRVFVCSAQAARVCLRGSARRAARSVHILIPAVRSLPDCL
jgi:hypothetical protein